MLEFDFIVRLGNFQMRAKSAQTASRMGLFGASGCGKTTLLNCLSGLLRPHEGYISLDGRRVFDSAARICVRPHRRAVGYVFQENRLFPHMTVADNIQYGRRGHQRGPSLGELTEVLGLDGLLDRLPASLSGGQSQRVALARALAAGPHLLLLDEPLASVDGPGRLAIMTYLKYAYEQWHVPFVYVSHSLSEVMFLCERTWHMEMGRIARIAHPRDLLAGSNGELDPILNVLRGVVSDRPEHTGYALVRCGEQELKVPGEGLHVGQTVTLGVPARDLILSLSRPTGISARNTFPATIQRTEQNGHALWITVEAKGNKFVAELTEDAGRQLDLHVGLDVHVVAKAHSIAVTPIRERQDHGAR